MQHLRGTAHCLLGLSGFSYMKLHTNTRKEAPCADQGTQDRKVKSLSQLCVASGGI